MPKQKPKTKKDVFLKLKKDLNNKLKILKPKLPLLRECAFRAGLDALVYGQAMIKITYDKKIGIQVTNVTT